MSDRKPKFTFNKKARDSSGGAAENDSGSDAESKQSKRKTEDSAPKFTFNANRGSGGFKFKPKAEVEAEAEVPIFEVNEEKTPEKTIHDAESKQAKRKTEDSAPKFTFNANRGSGGFKFKPKAEVEAEAGVPIFEPILEFNEPEKTIQTTTEETTDDGVTITRIVYTDGTEMVKMSQNLSHSTKPLFGKVLADAHDWIKDRNELMKEASGIGCGKYAKWNFDQATRELTFSDAEGNVKLVCDDTLVAGTFSDEAGSWMWSWCNPRYAGTSVTEGLQPAYEQYCREHVSSMSMMLTSSRTVPGGDKEIGWSCAALLCKILDAVGVYSSQNDHGCMFFIIRNLREVQEVKCAE